MAIIETRDHFLNSIRVDLGLTIAKSVEENFQNTVLRPILKFQNELLLAIFKAYVLKYHKNFNNLKKSAQELLIKNAAKQDPELRNAYINITVGLFTTDEYVIYLEQRAEANKRIVSMTTERVLSQLEKLY